MTKYFFFALFAFLLYSPTASAYEVATTTAYRLNDSYVLYTVSFKMGFLNRILALPITTNNTNNPLGDELNFVLEDGSGEKKDFKTHQVLLASKAILKDKKYYLPMGKNDIFTFVLVAEIPKDKIEYALRVTKLPYLTIDKDKKVRLALIDENSLESFVTEIAK